MTISWISDMEYRFETTDIVIWLDKWYAIYKEESDMIKKYLARALDCFLKKLTVYSVNTTCNLMYGQEEEPETLRRLKKHN